MSGGWPAPWDAATGSTGEPAGGGVVDATVVDEQHPQYQAGHDAAMYEVGQRLDLDVGQTARVGWRELLGRVGHERRKGQALTRLLVRLTDALDEPPFATDDQIVEAVRVARNGTRDPRGDVRDLEAEQWVNDAQQVRVVAAWPEEHQMDRGDVVAYSRGTQVLIRRADNTTTWWRTSLVRPVETPTRQWKVGDRVETAVDLDALAEFGGDGTAIGFGGSVVVASLFAGRWQTSTEPRYRDSAARHLPATVLRIGRGESS